MKNKFKLIGLLILACVIALYNFVLFMITREVLKTTTFWISYAFITFAFLLIAGIICVKNPYTDGAKLTLSVPVYRALLTYIVIEFIVGTLFMFLQTVANTTAALLVQVPLLIIFIIVVLVYYSGAKYVNDSYAKQKSDVFSKDMLCVQVNTLSSSASSPEVKARLENIAEKIRYSDFNSYPELERQDALISSLVSEMKYEAGENELKTMSVRLERLVDERNEMCKYVKKKRG